VIVENRRPAESIPRWLHVRNDDEPKGDHVRMDANTLIDIYCRAWSEPLGEARARLVQEIWAPSATYTDPTVHLQGVSELLAHITKVLERRPGLKVVRTSLVDVHHRTARFSWRAIDVKGNELPEGLDVAFISSDGAKLERVIGFFGPLSRAAG
jgi:hypothetical protein